MNCESCNKETENPKFCSKSCSAQSNNRKHPKGKLEGICKFCSKPIHSVNKYCGEECRKKNKENNKTPLIYGKCPLCGVDKTIENSFFKKSGRTNSYCKSCNTKYTKKRTRIFKQMCLDYKGGKCEKCGYNKCQAALDFHHKEPHNKEIEISKISGKSFNKKVEEELDKCYLLCANCHREEHYNQTND